MTSCRTRKAFILHVDLDPVPGTFHTPLSAYENIQAMLDFRISSFTPVAIFGVAHPDEEASNGYKRVCFIINVDLDPIPGVFHTQESAQDLLQWIFTENISHYSPIISMAPASIQPTCFEGIPTA